jgi:starch phosphorylase
MLFPATELSEQISTAGMEASGTGCMKAVLNGAILIGTLDGANIEIREEVGEDNLFVFGHTAEEIASGRAVVQESPELSRVIGTLTTMSGGMFKPLADLLLGNDRYFHRADFPSYLAAHQRAAETWTRREEWTRRSILNTARSGKFSADRTIREYASEIWLT